MILKDPPESGHRGNLIQNNKEHIGQIQVNIIHNGETLKAFPPRSRRRQGCLLSPLLLNVFWKVIAMEIWEENEIQGIQIGKEVKLSLFAGDTIFIKS